MSICQSDCAGAAIGAWSTIGNLKLHPHCLKLFVETKVPLTSVGQFPSIFFTNFRMRNPSPAGRSCSTPFKTSKWSFASGKTSTRIGSFVATDSPIPGFSKIKGRKSPVAGFSHQTLIGVFLLSSVGGIFASNDKINLVFAENSQSLPIFNFASTDRKSTRL